MKKKPFIERLGRWVENAILSLCFAGMVFAFVCALGTASNLGS